MVCRLFVYPPRWDIHVRTKGGPQMSTPRLLVALLLLACPGCDSTLRGAEPQPAGGEQQQDQNAAESDEGSDEVTPTPADGLPSEPPTPAPIAPAQQPPAREPPVSAPRAGCNDPRLPLPSASRTFYISASLGDDRWSGRLAEPNRDRSDGPKASLDQIAALASSAPAGTHLLLRRGDRWSTARGLQIGGVAGTEADPIVIAAYGDGTSQPVIDGTAANSAVLVVRSSRERPSSYLRIDGLHITSSSVAGSRPSGVMINEGLHPQKPHHITLSNMTIDNLRAGLVIYGDHHTIHGNRIANNVDYHGMYFSGANLRFRYNDMENNGPPSGWFEHSVYISNSQDVLFECSQVHDGHDGVKVRHSDGVVFRHNHVYRMTVTGIHLGGDSNGGANNNRIESNLIHDTNDAIVIKSESGTQIVPVDGLVIANNIIHSGRAGGYPAGLTLTNVPAQNVWIVNNLVYGVQDTGVSINNNGPNIVFANNIIAKFDDGRLVDVSASVRSANNLLLDTQAAFDALRLAEPSAFDFRPTPQSRQLFDLGSDMSHAVSADHDGNARAVGAGFDIGPYEYQQS